MHTTAVEVHDLTVAFTLWGFLDTDPPAHTRLRRLVNRGFTPRMVRRWEEVFKRITDETLDRLVGQGESASSPWSPRARST